MTQITWNTDVNAPCCPGEILSADGRNVLIQTDYDAPGVASTFGWHVADVGNVPEDERDDPDADYCRHEGTDGTIDCPDCGVKAGAFIRSALEWLADNDGAEADDPGYFDSATATDPRA